MIIVIMGVTGAGKTTVGRALARDLHWRFADADDYHSAANIAKMHAGIPLTDEDRAPWLERCAGDRRHGSRRGENVVLACSALKAAYRDILVVGSPRSSWCTLCGSDGIDCGSRWQFAAGHYMNPASAAQPIRDPGEPRQRIDRSHAGLTSLQEIVDRFAPRLRSMIRVLCI